MLTNVTIKNAKPAKKQYKLFDGFGLYLLVHPNGSKYWHLKYRLGQEKLLALGKYPDISLAEAREKRDAARRLIQTGVDPVAARRAEKQQRLSAAGNTFLAIANEWLAAQEKILTAQSVRIARRRLEMWVYPAIGQAIVSHISAPAILALLRKIEHGGRHETAHRVKQLISQICRYAVATGRADRDPTQDVRGALIRVPKKNRAAITDLRRVGDLLRAIDCYGGQPATRAALVLLALTFVRPGELRKAQWPEFDLGNKIWRIPAARMKMKREHLVPLSRQAIKILKWLHPLTGDRPYVFESLRPSRPLSENTLNYALRNLGYSGDIMTAHGFRATASTLLHEQGWPPEVIELQLAHAQRNQVAAAYNRSARLKEREKMMQAWADYLDSLLN